MGTFAYTALDRTGKTMSGTVPADTRSAAMDVVLGRGLSPVSIEEQRNGSAKAQADGKTFSRVPMSALESFTRELANLLSAG